MSEGFYRDKKKAVNDVASAFLEQLGKFHVLCLFHAKGKEQQIAQQTQKDYKGSTLAVI